MWCRCKVTQLRFNKRIVTGNFENERQGTGDLRLLHIFPNFGKDNYILKSYETKLSEANDVKQTKHGNVINHSHGFESLMPAFFNSNPINTV